MSLTKLNNASLSAVTSAGIPVSAGSVVQTVFALSNTPTVITGTAANAGTTTGLSVTITPTSTNNKLFINYMGNFMLDSHSNPWLSIEIYDDISKVAADVSAGVYINGDGNEANNRWRYPFLRYITPSSTNAITYTVKAWKSGSTATAQYGNQPSTILIQEIKV
jgi:hypothetical protein